MKTEFFFVLEEIPRTTAQEKGYNRRTGRYYSKKKVKDAADLYDFMLMTNKPPRKLTGAIRVTVFFYYPVKKPHKNGEPKITRPDGDNMVKLLLDRATKTGAFWDDDAQISDLRIVRAYSEPSGIGMIATEIGQGGIERD